MSLPGRSVGFPLLVGCLFLSGLGHAQIHWQRAELDLNIIPEKGEVSGSVVYTFLSQGTWDSIRMDSREIDIQSVTLSGKNANFTSDRRYLTVLPPSSGKTQGPQQLKIEFSAQPAKAFYFYGWKDSIPGNEQFWTQGQGKHHSHWFPGFDETSIKMEYDLTVSVPVDLPVISNGRLVKQEQSEGGYRWQFDMDAPMATYLVALALGDFDFREGRSDSGVPLRWYYPRGEEHRFEPTYRYSTEQFNWLETYLEVPYPWHKYDQVPVRDFMYGGMENTGATFFNPQYLVDSLAFEDSNYVSTNAHELAHQWFGNLVTETGPEDHWLHEGFATFIGSKAEIRYMGPARGYWELYNTARILDALASEGELQALNNPEASTETFYQKGAWALFMLEDLIGESSMQQVLKEFLTAYRFGNAQIADFFAIAERFAPNGLESYLQDWVYSSGFPLDQALAYLSRKHPEIKAYIALDRSPINPLDSEAWEAEVRKVLLKPGLSFDFATALFARALLNSATDIVLDGLDAPHREVRKAAILTLENMSPEKADTVWGMKDDPSYRVRERVLWFLWNGSDDYRTRILDEMDDQMGLPDRSLRSLWLALAIATEGYRDTDKEALLNELKSFASPLYDFPVREYALEFLRLLGAIDQDVIDYTVEASVHPYEGFRDTARALLGELMDNPAVAAYLKQRLERYTPEQQEYLQSQLR